MDGQNSQSRPSSADEPLRLSSRALRQAVVFMELNVGSKVRLQDIANAACVSRSHFARKFKGVTGCSPMKYLTLIRVERAKQLLEKGGMPIGAIAADLGFADQSHLIRHFRRVVGQTPRRYAGAMSIKSDVGAARVPSPE